MLLFGLRDQLVWASHETSDVLIHKLTASECRQILARARYGRLACARSEQPYVVPVTLYFDPDGDCLYGFSTLGQKIRWMRDNPMVCVEVEEVESRVHWTTVLVFGRYEEIPKGAGSDLRRRAQELFNSQPQWWLPGTATLTPDEQHVLPVVYRIRINKLTGRRAAASRIS